jgi:hypothetical protein
MRPNILELGFIQLIPNSRWMLMTFLVKFHKKKPKKIGNNLQNKI